MPTVETISAERAARLEQVLRKRQPTLTVVFENVHDSHNVSAVLRSCDAVGVFEAHGIYNGRTRFPDMGTKTSGSARKWIDLHLHESVEVCFSQLHARGFKIYTTHISTDAVDLYNINFTEKIALVFGNEHDGVSEMARNLADGNLLIPQMGMVQSLNISVACAVTLYEALRQRRAAGMYEQLPFEAQQFNAVKNDWFGR